MKNKSPKYKVGDRFKCSGKYGRVITIKDIWTTINSDGKIVKVRYIGEYDYLGITLTDRDICEKTIKKGTLL